LAFPCNQFASQEPGDNATIKKFACERQNAEYPLFDKVNVNGPSAHDLFKFLRFNSELHDAKENYVGHVHWNFGKFLVDSTGSNVYYLHSRETPDVVESVIKELLK
jgi:glutathione peroxidase